MESRKRPLLLAFCIPAAIMIAAVIYKKVYPFGDRCFLRVDLYNQYMPFFMEFHRKIREGGSMLFSWRAGLGANFLALYAYYLASPVNWLLFLCPESHIIEFMTLLIIIKIGLCGLSYGWYLKSRFRTEGYEITLFAVFYALSGYMAAYNWNIMWLDCIFLAPVVIFGLEELVYRRKPGLYCICLGISILTNYYLSIPVCIFLVLYYIVLAAPLSVRRKLRSLCDFTLYSLLAGGMAGAVLLPGTLALRSTRFDQMNYPQQIKSYFNLLAVLARHCINVAPEIRNDHWPNIYCGAAVFLFLPLYVCCRRIRWREKIGRLALLAFFYLSFSVNILEFFWHGLNFPDSLPARQSFLYIFLVLTMSFQAYRHFGEFSGGQIALTAGGGALFLYICGRFVGNDDFTEKSFLFTIWYLLLYALLVYWYRAGSLKKNLAAGLLFCMVVMEASLNTIETSVSTTSRSAYQADYQTSRALLSWLEEEQEDEGRFYRTERYGRMTKNDGMLADVATATFFSSTVNEAMAHFYRRMGMSSSKVFYCYDGATPLASALLSVDYTISDSLEITDSFHELLKKEEGKYLYRNRDTLPLGFMIAPDVADKWDPEEGDPAGVQNRLAQALGLEEVLLYPVAVTCEDGEAFFFTEENGHFYVYPEKCSTKNITADVAGYEKTYEKVYYPHFLDIGWCGKGSTVKLTQSGDKRNDRNELELSVYRINETALHELIRRLGRYPMEIETFSDTLIRASINAGEGGILATSIPNEAGWRVSVDGKPVPIRPFAGAMIGVELPAGKHAVTFSYRTPGLYAGIAVSAVSVLLFLLCRRAAARRG